MSEVEQELGKRLTVDEVAKFLGIDKKTVRENYDKLGGMRLGRLYLFFERSVINAIQKETQMDSPSAEGWEEEGESVSDEETGFDVGSQNEAKTRQRVEREDRHNLFG
jgi:DNA-directed RNA polymerase specialized sigma subunit